MSFIINADGITFNTVGGCNRHLNAAVVLKVIAESHQMRGDDPLQDIALPGDEPLVASRSVYPNVFVTSPPRAPKLLAKSIISASQPCHVSQAFGTT